MTCFDLCPHQMVSLQLLNPPSPPGSCLQTTFGFTHPLIFKNKHPSGVFDSLHCPLPLHLLLLAATLRSSATRPVVTVAVSGGDDGEEDLHPGMHLPPSPITLVLQIGLPPPTSAPAPSLFTPCRVTVAITPPAHSIPGCPHSYLGTSFIFYTPTPLMGSIKILVPCLNSSLLFILVCGSR